ncbi:MAG: low temperature requirement protein A [Alphaproteobacteria bacterium]
MARFFTPLPPRDINEGHRTATPLELFFDLAMVIAIAAAAHNLVHDFAHGHFAAGYFNFIFAFFAVWWAWLNLTWFASAFDDDGVFYRLTLLLIMSGALVMAAGLENIITDISTIKVLIIGYIIMRVGMAIMWFRAAAGGGAYKIVSLRYGIGIILVQVYWTICGFGFPEYIHYWGPLGWVLELSVPVYAEKANSTPWHRHHIIERYGLLNIIVLGEVLLSVVMAIREATKGGGFDWGFGYIAICAFVITCSLWWVYFCKTAHLPEEEGETHSNRRGFIWGYGHVLIFAAGAALGAGFTLVIQQITHEAHITKFVAESSLARPVAVYLFALWLVRDNFELKGVARWVLLIAAIIAPILPFFPYALESLTILVLGAVIIRSLLAENRL